MKQGEIIRTGNIILAQANNVTMGITGDEIIEVNKLLKKGEGIIQALPIGSSEFMHPNMNGEVSLSTTITMLFVIGKRKITKCIKNS